MHWHRLSISGPAAAVADVTAALVAAGATDVSRPERAACLIWRTGGGTPVLSALSRRHRAVAIASESAAELGDELVYAVSMAGETTVMHVEPALDPEAG